MREKYNFGLDLWSRVVVVSEKVVRGRHLSTGSAAAACLAYLPTENRINQREFPAAVRQMNTASIELTCGISQSLLRVVIAVPARLSVYPYLGLE
jgi:hypothetical protein